MTTTHTPAPDLAAIKARQQVTWTSGDYHAVAARIMPMAERLVEAADLPAGAKVLDVAAGSGNASLAAARNGCEVTGLDYVPELLERGRVRAAAEGLPVDFVTGDAEDLPYPDASFQEVLSCLGVLSAAKEKGRFGIGVDADQGYLGPHVLTSATKKVDVAVFSTIAAAQKAGATFRTGYDAIFSVKNGGVGYGKISTRVSAKLKTEVANIQKQIASGKIVVRRQSPPATTG